MQFIVIFVKTKTKRIMEVLKLNYKGLDYHFTDLSLLNSEIIILNSENNCRPFTKESFNWEWYNEVKNSDRVDIIFNPKFEITNISWYKLMSISNPIRTREFIGNISSLNRVVNKDDSPEIVSLKKWVHVINGNEVSLQWGNWVSSKYYSMDNIPPFIKKFMDNNPDKINA